MSCAPSVHDVCVQMSGLIVALETCSLAQLHANAGTPNSNSIYQGLLRLQSQPSPTTRILPKAGRKHQLHARHTSCRHREKAGPPSFECEHHLGHVQHTLQYTRRFPCHCQWSAARAVEIRTSTSRQKKMTQRIIRTAPEVERDGLLSACASKRHRAAPL